MCEQEDDRKSRIEEIELAIAMLKETCIDCMDDPAVMFLLDRYNERLEELR